jgi:hypothetical protein
VRHPELVEEVAKRPADAEAEFVAPLSEVDRAELIRILKLIVGHHSRL